MYSKILQVIQKMNFAGVTPERDKALHQLVEFIQQKVERKQPVNLHFICTHNSRRSQFSQIWAQVAADYYGIPVHCFSGGVEVTAFNERSVASLERFGFELSKTGEDNPKYHVTWKKDQVPLVLFSKMVDDTINPQSNFAAIMTCSHADENCPIVLGCEKRIAIRYEDPKLFDDSPLESAMYDCRSFEIATEMFYLFSKIQPK